MSIDRQRVEAVRHTLAKLQALERPMAIDETTAQPPKCCCTDDVSSLVPSL